MHGKHLYEYAVIRFVPRVEREEFINIGIIMFSKQACFIKARYHIDEKKIGMFSSEVELDSLYANLKVFDRICAGEKGSSPIAAMDIPERFRWLTAVRSSSLQTSRPHSGFSSDLETTFGQLFSELVL